MQGGRARLIWFAVIVLVIGGIIGYVFGRAVAHTDVVEARRLNQQIMTESQNLRRQIADQTAALGALQSKLTNAQAALEAIVPAQHTYNISPNQSLVVADGRLTIAMIGAPSNQGVVINVNGKQQTAAAGDVLKIPLDQSTTCEVEIQSFDLFKALLHATCPQAQAP